MPIKFEIMADTVPELHDQLVRLLAGQQPLAASQGSASTLQAELAARQEEINKAPAEKPKRVRDRSKAALAAKAAGNGGGVKPLPEDSLPTDDDPLAVADDEEDLQDDDDEPFVAPTEANLLVSATDKLRDLFKANAKGVAGVRALREKYQVKFFHQVPVEKAQELWADAVKLEAEMKA